MTLLTIDNSNLVINNESNCVNDYYDTRHSCNRVREDDFMMVFYKI